MVISRNSQLGLMFWDRDIMSEYLADSKRFLQYGINKIDEAIDSLKAGLGNYDLPAKKETDGDRLFKEIMDRLGYKPENRGSEFYTIKHPKPFIFLIQPSVEKCAAMIRINENFSCIIFNKIKDGDYMYLLGKNSFFHFIKFNGVIRGNFWNKENHIAFEVGFHLIKDEYYFPQSEAEVFNRLVRLMTFIELGDIETIILEKGRNNGKAKKDGKITNTSEFTVYVVDSSWNQLIIRTEGFAVMGHFRLQPCGIGFNDRKLIWINAFEKHGYKRSPRAEIVR